MSNSTHLVGTRENQVDTIVAKYFGRLDEGETVDRESFLGEHREHAAALREFFAAADFVEKLAGPTVSQAPRESTANDTARSQAIEETVAHETRKESPRTIDRTSDSVPKVLGRYQIKTQLGAGAMGSVYVAFDTKLQRQVALKIPKFQESEGEEFKERFIREARAAATLRSPNICPVYDVSELDGICFITMAYIEGQPLTERIDSGGFIPAAKEQEGSRDAAREAASRSRFATKCGLPRCRRRTKLGSYVRRPCVPLVDTLEAKVRLVRSAT